MFYAQGTCSVLVITCGEISEDKRGKDIPEDKLRYPFLELVSSGRLEVQTLTNPSKEEFCKLLESYKPNLVYLQGEQLENDEVSSLAWRDTDLSTAESISDIFDAILPTTVYLEILINKIINSRAKVFKVAV
ncbi:hypothetical protein ABKV19_010214 [Rosa sericea]